MSRGPVHFFSYALLAVLLACSNGAARAEGLSRTATAPSWTAVPLTGSARVEPLYGDDPLMDPASPAFGSLTPAEQRRRNSKTLVQWVQNAAGGWKAYEPNYFAAVQGVSDQDEDGYEIKLSFINENNFYGWSFLPYGKDYWTPGFDLSFTSIQDLYPGRYSAPLILRMINPGGEFYLHEQSGDGFGFGYYHLSNGQVVDAGNYLSYQDALPADQRSTWTDYISRGWDYFRLQGNYHMDFGVAQAVTTTAGWDGRKYWDLDHAVGTLSFNPEIRFFTGREFFGQAPAEENDWWDSDPPDIHLSQYDGLRLTVAATLYKSDVHPFREVSLSDEIRTGTWSWASLHNVSNELDLVVKVSIVPVYAFYFNGYGPFLSTYQVYNQYYGVGIRLW